MFYQATCYDRYKPFNVLIDEFEKKNRTVVGDKLYSLETKFLTKSLLNYFEK